MIIFLLIYPYNRQIFRAQSPSICANFGLQKRAQNKVAEWHYASQVAQHSFYIDNRLVSVEFREKAIQLKNYLNCVLAKGDFKLNKWATSFEKEVERQKALSILGPECIMCRTH